MLPVPKLEEEDWDEDEDEFEDGRWVEDAPKFQNELLAALESAGGTGSMSRPDWISNYETDEQQKIKSAVLSQQSRVENARAKLASLQHKRDEIDAADQLFLGTGRALEIEVKRVFELMNAEVFEPQTGREDWRLHFDEGDAVVEVKGLSKSAAESHAAQLEKWVSTVFEETGKVPKGILIVNTWREVPLADRNKADFPEQMLPYCIDRKHCLVTGIEMFLIRRDIEINPLRASYWREKMLNTSGRIDGCGDWQSVIHVSEQTE